MVSISNGLSSRVAEPVHSRFRGLHAKIGFDDASDLRGSGQMARVFLNLARAWHAQYLTDPAVRHAFSLGGRSFCYGA